MACRTVRPAEQRDRAAILALAATVAKAGDAFPWEETVSKEELAQHWLPDPQRSVETFVCEADGFDGAVGVYTLRPCAGGRCSHMAQGLYMVAAPARGRGLGKALCTHSLRHAKQRGYAGVLLNAVVSANAAAVQVCRSCGFRVSGTLPRAFRHPQRGFVDAYMMFHSLEDVEPAAPAMSPVAASADPAVAAPVPGLSYPSAVDGLSLTVGEQAQVPPKLHGQRRGAEILGATFTVQPALPEGMHLNKATGVISGVPTVASPATRYQITLTLEAEVILQVDEQASPSNVALQINEDFATHLVTVTDIADLTPEPAQTRSYGDWMIWMVHRAWLNDPALVELNFNNKHMPPAHIEERIAPKLMQAMKTNTHIEVLSLCNSNLQKPQAIELAEALQRNSVLRCLNLECNWLDSISVRELALAIHANPKSRIEHLRFSHQKQMGQFFGRPTEEAVGQMMQRNETILKLGFECDDAHWRNLIDRALLRNNDYWRRRQSCPLAEELPPAEERTLGHVLLELPPGAPTSAVFREDTLHHVLLRSYVLQNRKLPTTVQLQNCARNSGKPLPYAKAAPLIRECRAELLKSSVGKEVIVRDAFGMESPGTLRSWSESNEKWSVDIWAACGQRIAFRACSEPSFSVSEAFVGWLLGGKAQAGGG